MKKRSSIIIPGSGAERPPAPVLESIIARCHYCGKPVYRHKAQTLNTSEGKLAFHIYCWEVYRQFGPKRPDVYKGTQPHPLGENAPPPPVTTP